MGLLSLYSPTLVLTLVYMLQSCDYDTKAYLKWFWRTEDFRYSRVTRRRQLDYTKAARFLILVLRIGIALQLLTGAFILYRGSSTGSIGQIITGLLVIISYPVAWAHILALPVVAGRLFISRPAEKKLIVQSKKVFAEHPGVIIAVAGSYGKTTVKELLLTVLSTARHVQATPANKNVASSHAKFAKKLKGDEDVLVIEFGEGQPGDVARFTQTTRPNIGIITGIAPAHLDKYHSLEDAAQDIFSLAYALPAGNVYVNGESPDTGPYIKPGYIVYDQEGVMGWKISKIIVAVDCLSFTMRKGGRTLKLKSHLVGRHLVGTLAMVIAIAAELGLTDTQIIEGVAQTKPFEHRMQPRLLAGGWVIDDTYNGNLEGLRAGLSLLAELKATRKIYVTPGLVDQGREAERVHKEVGRLIAQAKPDKVVLMQNSVTNWIREGLTKENYQGELVIEDDPLGFYTNLDQVIAVGDVVLMQNDWTDNYN